MSSHSTGIRILCIEDHNIVRQGLEALIGLEPDMAIVGSAADGAQGIEEYRRLRPDIILLDLYLPTMSGFQTMQAIRREDPEARIVVLTMYQGEEDIYRAFEAGASAYLLKNTLAEKLSQTIRDAHAGCTVIPEHLVTSLANRIRHTPLTSREDEVLQLLAKGMRNKEIGARLAIREHTVETHLRSIFAKLDVHDRTAALSVAIKRGVVRIQPEA